MKPKVISAFAILDGTPKMLSLSNPTKSDIREFAKAVGFPINDTETVRRFNSKATVVTTTAVVVEQKALTGK
jgi:hypothetical protein